MIHWRHVSYISTKEKKKTKSSRVFEAKKNVEHEVILNMITTLPEQERFVLYAVACLTEKKKPLTTDPEP